MRQIDKIINSNEKIIWEGTPNEKVSNNGNLIFFVFIFTIVFIVSLLYLFDTGDLFTAFLIILVSLIFFALLYWISIVYNKNILYVITDKRVIIQTGLIGLDFSIIDFDKIQSMEVKVGLADKLFNENTGSIYIFSGMFVTNKYGTHAVPHSLYLIDDPYTVFEKLKKVSHDVKTDIEYPNDLRPKSNPGYNTEYKG